MLLQALLLLYHAAETETYLYKGTCGRITWPLDNCPEGFNLSIQLNTFGSDNAGRSPFNVPRELRNIHLMSARCWQLELECSEHFIRVTVSCYCSMLGSGLLPLRNASDEDLLSMDSVKWELRNIDAMLQEIPDNSTMIELYGCYDHGNGSYSLGSMFGTDRFVEPSEGEYSADRRDGPNCNYINEMVFPRESPRNNVVCIAVFVALMLGLTGAVLWSTMDSRIQRTLVS